jgi:hypothetical protein
VDLVIGQPETRRGPFVKALAEFAHGRVAALSDIGDDGFDGAADLGVGLFLLTRHRRGLDELRHFYLPRCSCSSCFIRVGIRRTATQVYMTH